MTRALLIIKRIHKRGGLNLNDLRYYLTPAERRRISIKKSPHERLRAEGALRTELERRRVDEFKRLEQQRASSQALYLPGRPIGMHVRISATGRMTFSDVDEHGKPKPGKPSLRTPTERWLQARDSVFLASLPKPRLTEIGNAAKTAKKFQGEGKIAAAIRRLRTRKKPISDRALIPAVMTATGYSRATVYAKLKRDSSPLIFV